MLGKVVLRTILDECWRLNKETKNNTSLDLKDKWIENKQSNTFPRKNMIGLQNYSCLRYSCCTRALDATSNGSSHLMWLEPLVGVGWFGWVGMEIVRRGQDEMFLSFLLSYL